MAASRNSLQSSLPAKVAAFLATRTTPGENICVGLSGGCDSVVLLHVLAVLGPRGHLRAVHVHHGLSANADRWADFCTGYCRDLGIDLLVERVEVDRHSGSGLEAAARAARYRVFSGSAGELLLLGHHQGDQAETVLFNLLRGAGVAGAAGIPVERRRQQLRILRPLLDVSRDAIEAYARDHRLDWVDDESNCDTGLSRNFLRHRVLTVLGARFPAAERNLAQAAGHFAEADVLLGELALIDWRAAADGATLPVDDPATGQPQQRRFDPAGARARDRVRMRQVRGRGLRCPFRRLHGAVAGEGRPAREGPGLDDDPHR